MYVEISESEIPAGVRFDVPGRNQGQVIEVAYGGFNRASHDAGDPYKKVTDRSVPVGRASRVTYYRWQG